MFSHSEIWMAIDTLAKKNGYSTSGLAKKAGLDPTAFNKSKRVSPEGKPRWPSTESIAKILSITGSSMTDLTVTIQSFQHIDETYISTPTIPVIGYAQAGNEGYFDDAGYPTGEGWDEVALPFLSETPDNQHYALEVSGDSMMPLYRDGDIIVVSPASGLRRGDRVVAKTLEGEVMAKELLRQTPNKVELKSLNPAHSDRSFAPQELAWIARILWVSQ